MKFIKKIKIIFIITALMTIANQGFSGQVSITGRVTKANNNTITIETIQAETIPEGSRVDLFFEISEGNSIEIGQWKVSGRGKGVIFAMPVDMIGPPQKGMTAKISYSDKKAPVITSSTPSNKVVMDTSKENPYPEIVPVIRGKEPKGKLLGIPFPEKSAKKYATEGDRYYFKKNYKMALKEYEQCARMGDAGCQKMLGHFYNKGFGVEKDFNRAREFYEESARQNNSNAIYNLGVMYANGNGVKKDMTKAHELFLQSANLGYPEAQFNLAVLYYNGMAVKKDKSIALKWFKKAADENVPKALYVVGQCHEFGFGTPKNMSKAKEYYKKAAELGDKDAIKKLSAQ
ncbi:MAG: tetratricopeptide repeat protein [Deltaproteobacteria bacterium]|jgi:hypothetical protein|nr:tetratricopeptide repeat protein [Deltaproteobacteria bacterium]